MEIKVSQKQGRVPVTVFHIEGDLTGEERLVGAAQKAYEAGARHVLLDMNHVPYVSSSGLRGLHALWNMLRGDVDDNTVRQGITQGTYKSPYLKLCCLSQAAQKALALSGYDMFLEIHKSVDDAISSF